MHSGRDAFVFARTLCICEREMGAAANMKAVYKNTVVAESDKTIVIENNHYFPPESVKMEYMQKSGSMYQCAWKGTADYYNVVADGEILEDAAWVYPEPTEAAQNIKGRFAFWRGVKVVE